jgi:site-specific DNA-cytosine methylase
VEETSEMRIIIACEFSGIVREEFKIRGFDAWSCDLKPTQIPGNHYKCDIRELDLSKFDIMIAHPPCTHLCVSGARWFKDKEKEQLDAIEFVKYLLNAPVNKIALENPVGVISSKIRKSNQIIHPWQFGDDENKKTCLWLKNLPKLKPTNIVPKIFRDNSIHKQVPSNDRSDIRSITFKGIAEAMAEQWGLGTYINHQCW